MASAFLCPGKRLALGAFCLASGQSPLGACFAYETEKRTRNTFEVVNRRAFSPLSPLAAGRAVGPAAGLALPAAGGCSAHCRRETENWTAISKTEYDGVFCCSNYLPFGEEAHSASFQNEGKGPVWCRRVGNCAQTCTCCRFGRPEIALCCGRVGREWGSAGEANAALPGGGGVCLGRAKSFPGCGWASACP